jgi:hypothetical protein
LDGEVMRMAGREHAVEPCVHRDQVRSLLAERSRYERQLHDLRLAVLKLERENEELAAQLGFAVAADPVGYAVRAIADGASGEVS